MDGGGARVERRRSIKERLGLKGRCCCGATWRYSASSMSVRGDDDHEELANQDQGIQPRDVAQTPPATARTAEHGCYGAAPAASPGMNLAAALAAERHFRAAQDTVGSGSPPAVRGTPVRVSLMMLLEETDGADDLGADSTCCVCMERTKGAAFIPCGHTFCRVCSRELWLNRGTCPLCNRRILEILDIF
ncbi:hypothetical protein NMG60_11009902 [Bertholletia excelsa]